MKNIFTKILLFASLLVLFAGCKEAGSESSAALVGDWHYYSTESDVEEDIWLSIASDGTFDLYQKIGGGVYWHSAGDYTIDPEKDVISGVYRDRYPWAYDYSFKVEGSTLTLTAVQLESYVQVYQKEILPAEVVEKSLELDTKSSEMKFKL